MSNKQPPAPPKDVSDEGPKDPHLPKAESQRIAEQHRDTSKQDRRGDLGQTATHKGDQ